MKFSFHYFFFRAAIFLSCCLIMAGQAFADDTKAYFLCLADIHFDPFVTCKSRSCPLIQALRQAPPEQWETLFSKYDTQGPAYRQDTNFPLLKSTLDASKKAAEQYQVKFILILGDFLAHDYHSRYRQYTKDYSHAGYQLFVKKTLTFITLELQKYFPSTDIYALVGNNDSYHRDYFSQVGGDFFYDVSYLWSSLIKDQTNRSQMQQMFKSAGYYAFNAPAQPNLRIIMLNTNLFSANAVGRTVPQAAIQQLDWLHQELLQAKAKQQKVLIAMHIPTGIDVHMTLYLRLFTLIQFWQEKYLIRFNEEMQLFSDEVIGILAGHVHADWFQILSLKNAHDVPVSGVPAISPIFGNNPGFKVYHYTQQSLQLGGFYTYYFPFKQRNTWVSEYDFNQIFLPHCLSCPLIAGFKLIQETKHLAELYQEFYAVSSDQRVIKPHWLPYYWCAIRNFYSKDYQQCLQQQ